MRFQRWRTPRDSNFSKLNIKFQSIIHKWSQKSKPQLLGAFGQGKKDGKKKQLKHIESIKHLRLETLQGLLQLLSSQV